MAFTQSSPKSQSGQAYAETLVGFVVIGLFLLGAHHLWRYAEVQQATVDAVRFAAWERVVWEPADNNVEKFALHKTDEALAKDAVLRQFSTPSAWRRFRTDLSQNGTPATTNCNTGANLGYLGQVGRKCPTTSVPATTTSDGRRDALSAALKSFVSPGMDPNNLITVSTTSGWPNNIQNKYRGEDPTYGSLTSLELDKETYRTVNLSFKSLLTPTTSSLFFDFLLPVIDTKKHLSLITNTWAGSPPMMLLRAERQLMPLSPGYEVSGTKPNKLAFFGFNPSAGANAADFVGMVPFWNLIGGANGFAGQYVVRQIGLDAGGANNLIQSAGQSFSYDPANPASSLLLKAQMQQSEFFNPILVSNWHHRHTFVIANTAEHGDEPNTKSRNSNIGKLKYRAFIPQNPIDNYFAN